MFNEKNLLNLGYINNTPLLTSNSKGDTKFLKNYRKEKIKKIKDINGMEIIFSVIKK